MRSEFCLLFAGVFRFALLKGELFSSLSASVVNVMKPLGISSGFFCARGVSCLKRHAWIENSGDYAGGLCLPFGGIVQMLEDIKLKWRFLAKCTARAGSAARPAGIGGRFCKTAKLLHKRARGLYPQAGHRGEQGREGIFFCRKCQERA